MILADPEGSVLADQVNKGSYGKAGSWLVEGIGEDFIPEICDFSMCRKGYSIPDAESFAIAREILRKEGLLVGSSTGTLVAAALRWCREQSAPKRVVTFACDTGNKYLSKLFNDFWMEDQGFIQREQHGDLRDLVGRPHGERATVTVGPGDVLATAHNRLRNAGFSQLPGHGGRAAGRVHRRGRDPAPRLRQARALQRPGVRGDVPRLSRRRADAAAAPSSSRCWSRRPTSP